MAKNFGNFLDEYKNELEYDFSNTMRDIADKAGENFTTQQLDVIVRLIAKANIVYLRSYHSWLNQN